MFSPSKERPTIYCTLPGSGSAEALYDTGAAVTLISEEKFRGIPVDLRLKKKERPFLTLLGADKKPMQVKGCFDMPIVLLNRNITTQAFVVSDLSSDMILKSV